MSATINEFKLFEDDLVKLIGNIQFRRHSDNFQRTLQMDAAYIRWPRDILVPTDKTKIIYTAHYLKVPLKKMPMLKLIRKHRSLPVSSVLLTE